MSLVRACLLAAVAATAILPAAPVLAVTAVQDQRDEVAALIVLRIAQLEAIRDAALAVMEDPSSTNLQVVEATQEWQNALYRLSLTRYVESQLGGYDGPTLEGLEVYYAQFVSPA